MTEGPDSLRPGGPGPDSDPKRFYHPELDGLRFVAFLFVFLHHAFVDFPEPRYGAFLSRLLPLCSAAGALGVDLFFCLSGYLISSLLLMERRRTGTIQVGKFYVRRALRIWPLYFAFIGLDAVLASGMGLGRGLEAHLPWFLVFLGNWSCAFGGYPLSPAALLWSVSIEEQFYVFLPPALRVMPARRLLLVPACLFTVSLATRLVLAWGGVDHPATWCATLSRGDPFAAGIVIALVCGEGIPGIRGRHRPLLFLGGGGLWLLGCGLFPMKGPATVGTALLSYPAFAAGAGLMLLACLRPAGGPGGPLAARPLAYLGRISYGLYVFHILVLDLVRLLMPGLGRTPLGLLALLATVLAALVSYHLIEKPFLRAKLRFTVVESRPGG